MLTGSRYESEPREGFFNALLAILIGLHFAPPFFFGLNGFSVRAAVLWAVFMAGEAVITGWRDAERGLVISFLIGAICASVWCIPTYYLGYIVSLQGGRAVKIAAIVLFSYMVTGVWILWRGFNESNPLKQPFFVSRYYNSRDRGPLVIAVLSWLQATFFAATLPGTRLSYLKREAGYWVFFITLIILGFVFLR
jgi:hypothetical protein